MTLQLFAHPFSSYCQKALIALYENATPFTLRMLDAEHPQSMAEVEAFWPLKRFPFLLDDGKPVMEATIIIEYLALHYPGPVQLIPRDPKAAIETRLMDRFFDNYIMAPMMKIVSDKMRPENAHDPHGVDEARSLLDTAYRWLDGVLTKREWAAGDAFSLADCAGAPSLFYADWAHEIDRSFGHLHAYRATLLSRLSIARAVDGGRPYRAFFPLGAPDRD